MLEFALATGQAKANFAQTAGSAELAELHGDELSPACETLRGVVRTVFSHGLFELEAREWLQELREDARKLLHGLASLDCLNFANPI